MPLHDGDPWQAGTAQVTLLLQELHRSHLPCAQLKRGAHRYLFFSGGYSSGRCDLSGNNHHFSHVLPLVEDNDNVRSVFFAVPEKFLFLQH